MTLQELFDRRVKGLVIAGHTHCGQVALPLIGPLWVPTEAPSFARCGIHESGNVTVFVTSGVGTSIYQLGLARNRSGTIYTSRFQTVLDPYKKL